MTDEGMTDEEIAEEFAKGLCKTCTVDTCRYNIFQTCAVKESIKQAFLAGLKAGRPKWHDLRKDPNDLPKETGSYVVSRFANYLKRKKVSQTLFFIKGKGWQTKMDKTQIIAWCEILHTEE